jgi:hypothetical protein
VPGYDGRRGCCGDWCGEAAVADQLREAGLAHAAAHGGLPPGFVIVAHFFDVESGRTLLHQPGQGTAHEAFNIPVRRDGGNR